MSGDDPSARTRVDGPEATRSDPHTRSAPVAEVRVGRYAVLETLGRGGMGIVFRAYDPKLRREVAIKRLHKSVVGEKTGARLVREAQALAQLSHPNVVAVYDVEAGDAGVLMVMELVRGMTLQDWLAEDERGAAPVLDLFLRAGRGLAAAHREGLVHRDFKPANVMVDVSTDVPIVKVTDFGLARALGPGQTDPPDPTDAALASPDLDAPLTEAGVVMGTPRYMAPEQHTGRATDGRTDQYAFCIALWEALAGSPPFPLDETLAKRKLKGPPAWPRSALGGDPIGAVVVRGLAADPDARWPSMEALLGALAPTQSTSRAAWVVGAALLATIGSAVAFATGRADALCTGAQAELDGTWDQSRKAAVEATILATKLPYAEATLTAVQESLDAYAASWVAQHTDACRATSVRGDQSAAAMDLRMRCLRRAKVRLLAATDLLVEADATIVEGAVALTNDLPDPERCGDLDALQEGPPPPAASIAEAVEAATTELATASSLYSAGKYAQAADAAQTVFDAATELDYAPLLGRAGAVLGGALAQSSKPEAAEAALRTALTASIRAQDHASASLVASRLVYTVGDLLARPAEGRWLADFGLALALAHDPDGHLEAQVRNDFGNLLAATGKYDEAVLEYRQAIELREASSGSRRDPNVATARANLAAALDEMGNHAEAEAELRRSLSLLAAAVGPGHPDEAPFRTNLAVALASQGKDDEAETQLRSALSLWESAYGTEHPGAAMVRGNLATMLSAQGRGADAEVEYREALRQLEASLGKEHRTVGRMLGGLARAQQRQGKVDEARATYEHAAATLQASLGPEHPEVGDVVHLLGRLLLDAGRPDEALSYFERGWSIRRGASVPPEERGDSAFFLAQALGSGSEARTRARELARQALTLYEEAGDDFGDDRRSVSDWLEAHPGQ